MKKQAFTFLSLGVAMTFSALELRAEDKGATTATAAKPKAKYVKYFEKSGMKFKSEDLMKVDGIPLGSATPSNYVQIIFEQEGKNYLYLNSGSFIPTSNDRLFELSDKYMTASAKKSYKDRLNAFEKKQEEASKKIEDLEEKPENKSLSAEKLEAKLKPEVQKLEEMLKMEAKKVQYSVDAQGNLLTGGQVLISRYNDLLADRNAEFRPVLISSTDISRGRMMEHAAMSMGEMGVDNIDKIIVVYRGDKTGGANTKNLVYDLQKLQATKDGKPIDFSDRETSAASEKVE